MVNKKTKIIILILLFFVIFMHCNIINAVDISQVEFTPEYREWLELSEEERNKIIAPKMFNIERDSNTNSVWVKLKTLMSSVLEPDFDLRSKMTLKVKNQKRTNACWAFATLSSLETNLALKNNMKETKDYSESHMDYSTSSSFYDGEIENGFTREVSEGGHFQIGATYLTNGMGAILEEEMPFIDTKEDISIKAIQNKKIVTKVTDTEEFSTFISSINKEELMLKMKEHIKSNGAISAGIHGAKLDAECYNSQTGAIFCEDSSKCKMDHNVSIIGWDDKYLKENFNNSNKITNNGAWIIRNSWGENHGKDGFMYVSYEDANIYDQLFGIEKATEDVDYDKIYQHHITGFNNALKVESNKVYMANVFQKNTKEIEELTEVSLNVTQKVKCKVYINPNGDDKTLNDLHEVELKDGKSETFDAGYHTLEFKKPIRLNGEKFVVVIEMETIEANDTYCAVLSKASNNFCDNIQIKENISYLTVEEGLKMNEWMDMAKLEYPSNLAIKAFARQVKDNPTPTVEPTSTIKPTNKPTPTAEPTSTIKPTNKPTPTVEPTSTIAPTNKPTPTVEPTSTIKPTTKPTSTVRPTMTLNPTIYPTTNIGGVAGINGGSNGSETSGITSTKTDKNSLPHAGKEEVILGLIAFLIVNMVVVYKKYKKIY